MFKILITGGAGFIGSNFIIYHLDKYPDDKIINLDNLTYAGNLENLKKGMPALSEKIESVLNNFITYGVDENTQKLGEGERAAVIYSYKFAFNKLPESEEEITDVIKIANGRWPSITNQQAEEKAKEEFQKYLQKDSRYE